MKRCTTEGTEITEKKVEDFSVIQDRNLLLSWQAFLGLESGIWNLALRLCRVVNSVASVVRLLLGCGSAAL
jgi:hypothetical protein